MRVSAAQAYIDLKLDHIGAGREEGLRRVARGEVRVARGEVCHALGGKQLRLLLNKVSLDARTMVALLFCHRNSEAGRCRCSKMWGILRVFQFRHAPRMARLGQAGHKHTHTHHTHSLSHTHHIQRHRKTQK